MFLIISDCCNASKGAAKRKAIFKEDKNLNPTETVKFFLFTRKNLEEPQQLWLNNNKSIQDSNFEINKSTKFKTHGWKSNYLSEGCNLIKNGNLINILYKNFK